MYTELSIFIQEEIVSFVYKKEILLNMMTVEISKFSVNYIFVYSNNLCRDNRRICRFTLTVYGQIKYANDANMRTHLLETCFTNRCRTN